MILRDGLGNEVDTGDLMFWMTKGLQARVLNIAKGGLSVANSTLLTPAKITLEVEVTLQGDPRQAELFLGEFLCLRDPKAGERAKKILEMVQ